MDTVELACCLIGKVVVHDTDSGRLIGPIVETEGHPVGDAAGHAYHVSQLWDIVPGKCDERGGVSRIRFP